MKKLIDIIKEAEEKKTAIGHFNISEISGLRAIVAAAKELKLPVIIAVSEGERDFIGVRQAAALIQSLREECDFELFLNADHTHSLEKIKEAVEAGYDAVIFDGAKLPIEENIKLTKEVVDYVKSVSPDVIVEGELGYIGSSSKILKSIPEGAAIKEEDLTMPEEALRFVKETSVDLLAPAVGNIHGILARTNADLTRTNADSPAKIFENLGGKPLINADNNTSINQHKSALIAENPRLNIERIKKIKRAVGVPLVLHGGSGIVDDDFLKAIDAGISIIHINTELRLAWRKGLEAAFLENKDEIAPYKLLLSSEKVVYEVVKKRLKLFNKSR